MTNPARTEEILGEMEESSPWMASQNKKANLVRVETSSLSKNWPSCAEQRTR